MGNVMLPCAGIGIALLGATAFVGRATAQQAPPPPARGPRYQRKCVTGLPGAMSRPEALLALNAEGAQGWRLRDGLGQVRMSGVDRYCFERQ